MSALARIRKTALQHEQERQYDKALALYARLLDGAEAGDEELDVALFNRAGDLALRVGDLPRALGYFERALDLYAAGGMLNNAVALGVKILRHAPAHLSAHYTLGVLYGRKGFVGDARHHLLTYAVQMQRAGRADEAARVLGEVAAGCTDAGERRAALDAYGALGGDPAQAVALTGEPSGAPVVPPPAPAPAAAVSAPVTWGAVDFEPVIAAAIDPGPAAVEPPAVQVTPLELLATDVFVVEATEPAPGVGADAPAAIGDPAAWDVIAFDTLALVSTAPAAEPPAPAEPGAPVPDVELMGWDTPVTTAAHEPARHEAWNEGWNDASPLVFLDLGAEVEAVPVPLDDAASSIAAAPPARVALADDADGPAEQLRWPHTLADGAGNEPAPLRLAELLRLDEAPVVEATAFGTEFPRAAASGEDPEPSWSFVAPEAYVPVVAVPDPALADAFDVALELPSVRVVEAAALADEPLTSAVATPPLVEVNSVQELAQKPAEEPAPQAASAVDEPLDLGAWLRETAEPTTTRLTTASVPQTGDEQADFDATLRAFTAGVSRAVAHEDWDSHYDLGVAFREMGLVEEAIVEFQRAARAPGRPLRALEALAQCFLDAGQPELALTTLEGPAVAAAAAGVGDASLLAVHYLMGSAAQALGRPDDARRWLVRAVATDVRFRDAAQRLAALPPPSPVR